MTATLKRTPEPRHTVVRLKRPTDAEYARIVKGHAVDLQRLNGLLATGQLTPKQWADGFNAILIEGHGDAYALGRQRAGDLSPKQLVDQIQGIARADGQNKHLQDFLDAIDAGDPRYIDEEGRYRLDGLNSRARMYASAMRATANEAFLDAGEPDDVYDWILGPTEHCEDCLSLHEISVANPFTRDTIISYPGDGQTECRVHCACTLRRRRGGISGFSRPDIFGDKLAGEGDPSAREYDLRPVDGATETPTLPILEAGRLHLDLPATTTPADLRRVIHDLDREVLAIFDPETLQLTHAPILGKESSVDFSAFADELRGKLVIHNHPSGSLFSPADIRTCYEQGLAELQATSPTGEYFSVKPKGKIWKSQATVSKAMNEVSSEFRAWVRDAGIAGNPPSARARRLKYNELFREAVKDLPLGLKRFKA